MNSKPRRAKGGLCLLSHTISVQKSQLSKPLILEKKRGEGEDRERGRRQGGEMRAAYWSWLPREREERERGI